MEKHNSMKNVSSLKKQIYEASKKRNITKLKEIITSLPEDEAKEVIQNFSYADWKHISQQFAYEQKRRKKLYILLPILLFAIILILVAIFWLLNPDFVNQQIHGTYTPTATATLKPTPIPTKAPTAIPTKIPPTLIPTVITESKFKIINSNSIYPKIPAQSDSTWMIGLADTMIGPGRDDVSAWKKDVSTDSGSENREYYYSNKNGTRMQWTFDQPLPQNGIYGIYILDKQKNSKGPFSFKLQDTEGKLLAPFRGTGNVTLLDEREQKTDLWQMIGFYNIPAGTRIQLTTNIDVGGEAQSFAVDRLLIIKLNEQSSDIISRLPQGRTLMTIFDDNSLNTLNYSQIMADVVETKNVWENTPMTDAWAGSAWVRKPGWPNPPFADWKPGIKLPAGKYELYVWIPSEHATAKVSYALTLDGQPIPSSTPRELEQKLKSVEWYSLGIWDINKEGLVSVRISADKVQPDMLREMCADAVAILSVNQ